MSQPELHHTISQRVSVSDRQTDRLSDSQLVGQSVSVSERYSVSQSVSQTVVIPKSDYLSSDHLASDCLIIYYITIDP